ncbi:MAG: cyclic nucleotide-binding domain-containing protein [Candidatus Cloacimonetes bacterium]|nr:cyclic nucleotide-binding domain-containing protein [Candidatus Cloacimonadota bacterium]
MPEIINIKMILLNSYYVGLAVALLIKDILWLRTVMIIAGICVITYGILSSNNVIVGWNSLFATINIFQVIRILIENKGVKIDENVLDIYNNVFSDMAKKEFLRFWKQGQILSSNSGDIICKDGVIQEDIFFIINGKVTVQKNEKKIVELSRGHFVAEMGFLTGKPASADVIAGENLRYIMWSYKKLKHLNEINPDFLSKLQLIISKDLTQKLRKYL